MTQAFLSPVQHIDIELADTETTKTVAISAGDTLKCTPLASHRLGNTDESDAGADYLDIEYLTLPNRIKVTRAVGDGSMSIHIANLEWDTSVVGIKTGTFAIADSDETDDVLISAVTLAKTWMVMAYQRESNSAPGIKNYVRGMHTTTTNIHFERKGGGTGGLISGHWWSIEDIDGGLWDVQRILDQLVTNTSDDIAIAPVVMGKTFVVGTEEMIVGGNNADAGGVLRLLDFETLRYTRVDDGSMALDIYVVTLLQSGDSVQRGAFTLGSGTETDSVAISPLNHLRSFANAPTRQNSAGVDTGTYEPGSMARIRLPSGSVLEVSCADDSTVSEVNWEAVQLHEDGGGPQHPVVVGTNF